MGNTYIVTVSVAVELDDEEIISEEELRFALAENFQAHPAIAELGELANHLEYENIDDYKEPSWIDRHSVNCIVYGNLADERDCRQGPRGVGDVCPRCPMQQDDVTVDPAELLSDRELARGLRRLLED